MDTVTDILARPAEAARQIQQLGDTVRALTAQLAAVTEERDAALDDAHKWATLANSAANERDAAAQWRDNFKSDLDAANTSLSAAIKAGKSIAADRDKAVRLYDVSRAEVAHLKEVVRFMDAALRGDTAPARAEAGE